MSQASKDRVERLQWVILILFVVALIVGSAGHLPAAVAVALLLALVAVRVGTWVWGR